ncbi:Plasmodium vivax Vir protein, putative [Plasmodium vivax]|nr:Plasmodium vivax Vir protein, putative [Plasmodium vivax]
MLVRLFSEYKKEIEKYKDVIEEDMWVGICDDRKEDYSSYINNVNDNICLPTMRYLNYSNTLDEDNTIESRCKYLFYWLYYEYFQGNEDTQKTYMLHNAFLDISRDKNKAIEEKYKKKINEDVLKKFKAPDDMYGNLNKIEEKSSVLQDTDICRCAIACANEYMNYKNICSTHNDDNFCDVIENIRERYNTLIKNVNNCEDAKETLPSFKNADPILSILIHVVTALVILFVLLILYKFTAFGSMIRSKLRRKNKIEHSIYENTNHFLPSPKKYNMNSDNRQYHITYSS